MEPNLFLDFAGTPINEDHISQLPGWPLSTN